MFDDLRIGVVAGERVADVTGALPELLASWPEQRMNWVIRNWAELQAQLGDLDAFPSIALDAVRLRAVNPAPPQLFAIPANFHEHIGELADRAITPKGKSGADARFFLKAAGSVSGPSDGILLPNGSLRRFDHECELGVVIGVGGANIRQEDALDHVFGYTCLIDMTMRIEKGKFEEDRSLRKSFQTFTPVGPALVTADEVPDVTALRSRLFVNDDLRQSAHLADMIVSVPEAIELISSVVALQPGDIIASGTPKGVGPVGIGDCVRIEIDTIGAMTLAVSEAPPSPRPF
ncbi:fumarylacetoacetate hydrolase family protein [Microbacterium sp. NPDC077663]|uniref:fumarylacetoacetate hydrolase family protein n=1 Tax=Microbacterium sp. NPDC077663 TaxID=3364189 RepID=UPI0037C515F7